MEIIREIAERLVSEGAKISTAESCTAGYVSRVLTLIPGSSDYFEGSMIVYSNNAKIKVLGIEEELIDKYTEVSSQVACRMAERIKEIMGTEYSIATTGYADSDGFGTEENPAGTIFIALSTPSETIVNRIEVTESRSRNIYLATIEGLEMMRKYIRTHQVV